jgi:hypothetical protein
MSFSVQASIVNGLWMLRENEKLNLRRWAGSGVPEGCSEEEYDRALKSMKRHIGLLRDLLCEEFYKAMHLQEQELVIPVAITQILEWKEEDAQERETDIYLENLARDSEGRSY